MIDNSGGLDVRSEIQEIKLDSGFVLFLGLSLKKWELASCPLLQVCLKEKSQC